MDNFIFIIFFLIAIGLIGFAVWNAIRESKAKEKAEEEYKSALLNTGIEQVKNLTPYEFEEWVAKFLSYCGYNAYTTKRSGDYGVDVIAEKNGTRIAIQVKKYSNPLGVKCVQEVIGGMGYYGADEGWVVSTAPYFTRNAHELASTRNIKLYNLKELALMLNRLQQENGITVKNDMDAFVQEKQVNHVQKKVEPQLIQLPQLPILSPRQDDNFRKSVKHLEDKFWEEYNSQNPKGIIDVINQYINIQPTSDDAIIAKHFFYVQTSGLVHSLSKMFPELEDLSIKICNEDRIYYNNLSSLLKNCQIVTLTRLCIIYEQQGKIQEAIELCKEGMKYNFIDTNKKSFVYRKQRLEKKLEAS